LERVGGLDRSISMGRKRGHRSTHHAVSAIANEECYKPHVIAELRRGISDANGRPAGSAEPRRVIRPETAATLKRPWKCCTERDRKLAHLDGLGPPRETGSAQKIDPATADIGDGS